MVNAPADPPVREGQIIYYIEGRKTLGTYFGLAYQVQPDLKSMKVVATAVSGTSARVKSMLKAKLKAKGIVPSD